MLDLQTILWCHARVPVCFWPVLWVYLRRLSDTYIVYAEEGRDAFHWHLERNGVIWVSWCDASDAERAARGELPRDFDRTPWTRLEPSEPGPSGAGLWLAPRCTLTVPPLAPHRPLAGPGLPLLHPP